MDTYTLKILRKTRSICPECFKVLDAEVFVDTDGFDKIRRIIDLNALSLL